MERHRARERDIEREGETQSKRKNDNSLKRTQCRLESVYYIVSFRYSERENRADDPLNEPCVYISLAQSMNADTNNTNK